MPLRTDLEIVQLPLTLPDVGGLTGANTVVTDPDFGAQIVRLTDGSSGNGAFDSMQTIDDPSGRPMWNVDDTLLIVRDTGSNGWLFQFNPSTMQGTQLGSAAPYKVNGHYCFSRVHAGVLYVMNGSALTAMTFAMVGGVWTYQNTTTVCDFAAILPGGFTVNWISGLTISEEDTVFAVAFSQGNQNTGFYACLYKPGAGLRMINTQTLAVTGDWGMIGTATLQNSSATGFYLHGVNQPPNPNYLTLSPVAGGGGHGSFVWQSDTLTLTQTGLSGHHGLGFLSLYTGNPGGGQYDQAFYATPAAHTTVIPKQAGPPGLPANQSPAQSYTGDQHSAFSPIDIEDESLLWITNGEPSIFPFTSCWMGEVRGLDVTGAISGSMGTVYRLCHTFNSGQSTEYIVTNAQLGVSRTGNFIAFTSDWGGAGTIGPLGSTSGAASGTLGVDARGDVFIARVPQGSLEVSSLNLADGVVADSYMQTLDADGGVAPYSWALTAGTLPAGLSLSSSGLISGTPTLIGSSSFTVTVTDSEGTPATAIATLSITIQPALSVSTSVLPAGTTGSGYSQVLAAAGGVSPYTWSIASGSLPPGLTLGPDGTISGTPSQTGAFSFTVEVEDSEQPSPDTATGSVAITIVAPPPAPTIFDSNLAILAWLQASTALAVLVGTNIFSPVLPEGFSAMASEAPDPSQRAVVVRRRGGRSNPEVPAVRDPSFAIECWAMESPDASQVYGVIRNLMHGSTSINLGSAGFIILSLEEVPEQDIIDPETHWAICFGYYHVKMRAPDPSAVPYAPQYYSGAGAPVTLHNDSDLYYDTSTGNLYEQVSRAWQLVGNIPQGTGGGGSIVRYDNQDIGGLTPTGNPNVWQLSVAFTANAMVFRNQGLLAPTLDYSTAGNLITYVVTPASDDVLAVVTVVSGSGGGSDMPSIKYHRVATSGLNTAVIKASAGLITGGTITNDTEYEIFVKIYDSATAPNVGVDVPAQTIGVQSGVSLPIDIPEGGLTYSNGIAIAITKGMADEDATPVVAEDCVVDIFYQ
jgi:hypothetical protein